VGLDNETKPKKRIFQGNYDYFTLFEEEKDNNMSIIFNPRRFNDKKELLESFEKNILGPAR
jgi:hypothetical protein